MRIRRPASGLGTVSARPIGYGLGARAAGVGAGVYQKTRTGAPLWAAKEGPPFPSGDLSRPTLGLPASPESQREAPRGTLPR